MDMSSRARCLPRTREIILNRIIDWALRDGSKPGHKNIFWLHGVAGSGKSTIATTIAEYFHGLGRQGAYLFFQRSTSQPSSVIRTMAFKLARFDRRIEEAVSESLHQDPEIIERSYDTQFEMLLHQPLIQTAHKLVGPVVIVLDAFDECGDERSREDLLDALVRGLPKLPTVFRFLVTSRRERDINSRFSTCAFIESMQLVVGKDGTTSDIRAYIYTQLFKIRDLNQLPRGWPKESAVEQLVDWSGGLFIWASTVSKLLRDAANPMLRLDDLLSSRKVDNLDSLYSTALEWSCTWQDLESWKDFRLIMAIVLFSREAVSDQMIDRLLDRSERNSCRFILGQLSCLLDNLPGQPIRPLHASFRDYLTDNTRGGDQPWSLTSVHPERLLTECCLRVMRSQLHFNMFGIKTSHKSNQDNFANNAKAEISPELSYACENWSDHLKSVQNLGQSEPLVQELYDFGTSQFLFWLEVIDVMELYTHYGACHIAMNVMKVSIVMFIMDQLLSK